MSEVNTKEIRRVIEDLTSYHYTGEQTVQLNEGPVMKADFEGLLAGDLANWLEELLTAKVDLIKAEHKEFLYSQAIVKMAEDSASTHGPEGDPQNVYAFEAAINTAVQALEQDEFSKHVQTIVNQKRDNAGMDLTDFFLRVNP